MQIVECQSLQIATKIETSAYFAIIQNDMVKAQETWFNKTINLS